MEKGGCEVVDDRTLCLKIAESSLAVAATSYCTASKDTEPEAVFLDTPNWQEGGGKGALRSSKVVLKWKKE